MPVLTTLGPCASMGTCLIELSVGTGRTDRDGLPALRCLGHATDPFVRIKGFVYCQRRPRKESEPFFNPSLVDFVFI